MKKKLVIFALISYLSTFNVNLRADYFILSDEQIVKATRIIQEKINGAVNFIVNNVDEDVIVIPASILFFGSIFYFTYLQHEFQSHCCNNIGLYYDNPDYPFVCSLPRIGDVNFALLKFYCPVSLIDRDGSEIISND